MSQLISIIVPIYNAEKTLKRCVSALIGQTYKNIEIILVNDGSKDSSLDMCRCFEQEDERIRVIDKPNGGVSSARNAGLDIAKGEFVMFCDSDDWAEPNWCEELVANYTSDSLTMCGYYIEGKQTVLPYEIKAKGDKERYCKRNYFDLKLRGFYSPWNKIYSLVLLRRKKIRFDERLSNGEDLLFNVQYLCEITGDIIVLDKCIFHYNWPSEKNLSNQMGVEYFEKWCILFHSLKTSTKKLLLDGGDGETLPVNFYNEFYAQFDKIKHAVLSLNESLKNKYLSLKVIMCSDEYQEVAYNANISTNKIYCKICRSKNPIGLMMWYMIFN